MRPGSDWQLATPTMTAAVQQHPLYQELLPNRSEISERIPGEFAVTGTVIASQTIAIVQFPSTPPQGKLTLAVGQLEEPAS